MKYALVLALLVETAATADETTTDAVEVQVENEFTKDELVAAKKSKERFLDKLRADISVHQDRLNRSRAAVDSQERKDLKAVVTEKKSEFSAALKQPMSHWVKQAELDREEQEKIYAKVVAEATKAREQAQEQTRETRENRPLSIEALGLHSNIINLPQLVVVTTNNTGKPVEAYTVSAECFNKFDEPVKDISGNNVFSGISQDTIQAGQKGKSSWQMSLHRNTAYARVWLTRVRFSDGTEWHQTKDEALSRRKAIFRIDMD